MKYKMKMLRLCCLAACLLAASFATAQQMKPLPSIHVDGRQLVDTYGNPVVLHGVMDTPSAWFNNGRWGWSYDDAGRLRCLDYFEKLFTAFEQAHCTVFRLHLEPAWTNDGSITAEGFTKKDGKTYDPLGHEVGGEADISHFSEARLKTYLKSLYFPLMQKAMAHGLYVVVRPPGVCPGEIRVDDYYQKYLIKVWDIFTQNDSIRRYPGQISIELANEPVGVKNAQGASDKAALRDFFQPVVNKIRENGFKGIIWVPGAGWQASYADYATFPIEDVNFGYAVHDYNGWYGCDDKNLSVNDVKSATQRKITQFHNQVPVVDTNPIIITEIDWSPFKPGSGHYNEHNEWVESNYGTWATGRTSVWGTITKNVYDHYGNVSMTLSGSHCLIDVDTLIQKNKVVPSFDGLEEACGKACMDWYAEYYTVNYPHPDFNSVPYSDMGAKYQNPIVRADFPDPDVIRVGNTYYMVSTTMSLFPGATILKSTDMVNWEYCAQPLQQLTSSDEAYQLKNGKDAYACGMWAPSMKYHDGKFYLLINEKRPIGGWNLNGWLLTTTNPEGTWTAKKLSRSYYDPGMLFDDGKIYVAQGIGNISVCEVDANFNCKKEVTVISGKDGLEGCHFYKKGNYYYIYATYGGWPSGQAVFRSEDPFGPYEEKMLVEKFINGAPNTIHQGSLIEDSSGKWWTIMQQDLGYLGRFPNLQPVKWTDDWPIVGNNGVPYESYTKPKAVGDNSVKRLPTTDNFRDYPLPQQWEWNHAPDNDAWSLFERPGWLRLKTTNVVTRLTQARNMLTQRIFINKDKATNGTIRLDVRRMQEGDRAGICVFQDPYAMIGVEVKDGKHQLFWRQDTLRVHDNFTPKETVKNVDVDSIVYLRASADYSSGKSKFYYSLDNKRWTALGSETSHGFSLTVFFGARFGLYYYSTKTSGGAADFDWFTTEDSFDEETLYPAFESALDPNMFTATKIVPAKKNLEVMIGGWCSPGITATFQDRHKENVTSQTSYEPDVAGIVEFNNGQMTGVGQGTTRVKATYTDPFGNALDTAFTVKSTYFPLDPQYITTNVSGTNTYTSNARYGIFKFSAEGQAGWVFSKAINVEEFKYLVIQLYSKQTADAHVNIYTTTNVNGACFSSEKFGDEKQIVINLEDAKYTSKTSNGRALNRKSIRMVTFTGSKANKPLYFQDMFFTNDPQYDPTGVVDLVTKPEPAVVNVYTTSGQLLRNSVNREQAAQGLPAGIYIIGGKKVMVK
jgi:beta-xylosidase